MPEQVRDQYVLETTDAEVRDSAIARDAIEKPYAKPLVASFALDSDNLDSADALTANG